MVVESRTEELNRFKSEIDFCALAASYGFQLDKKKSSPKGGSILLRHANGDKLVVTRSRGGHTVYFNVHDSADQGSIIDFLLHRENISIGEVRKKLRPWLGGHPTSIKIADYQPVELTSPVGDRKSVNRLWRQGRQITEGHPYLEEERHIPRRTLLDPVFSDRIRIGQFGNALFPHFGDGKLTGIEMKNQGFTSFSPGGTKSLFSSRRRPADRELWICETAIDALSVAALFGTGGKRFLSTAGQISPYQAECLRAVLLDMHSCESIVLAMDHDEAGDRLAARLRDELSIGCPNEMQFRRKHPDQVGRDWNDELKDRALARRMLPTPV